MNRITLYHTLQQPANYTKTPHRLTSLFSRHLHTKSYQQLSSKEVFELTHRYVAGCEADVLPIAVKSAFGPYIVNCEGNLWLDFNGSYGAVNFGHRPSEVTVAESHQSHNATLPSRAYYNDILPQVAQKLHAWYSPILQCSEEEPIQLLPKTSGGEACDSAIKLMRKASVERKKIRDGNQLIVVFNKNFHGRPMGAISASDQPIMKNGFGPLAPGFIVCELNNEEQLKSIFAKHGKRICGAMIEYVQGIGGVHVATNSFISTLRELTTEHKAMLIADDVQAGWGRTGKISPSEHYSNGKPDGIVFGKSCSGGVNPVAGLVAGRSWMQALKPGTEGSTYGGNPKSMATVLATMDLYEKIDLGAKLSSIGNSILGTLQETKENNTEIKDVRGLGAMLAVEWRDKKSAKFYQKRLLKAGRPKKNRIEGITLKLTEANRTMRLNPPLMTDKQLDESLEIIARGLRQPPSRKH